MILSGIGHRWIGAMLLALCLMPPALVAHAQKRVVRGKTAQQAKPVSELAKLRQEFVEATTTYKASLEKLRVSYEKNVTRAESELEKSQALYAAGLISKSKLNESAETLKESIDKVAQVEQQLAGAETQIANALVETEAEAKLATLARAGKGPLVSTTSYIRFAGSNSWMLSDAWKVQRFFLDTFKRELPIGVFGQGAIHDRWHLDHRNAMDVSVNPDSVEGQAMISFLRANGISFLAFRQAIPGTATGPHIHIGRPSHRF